jgi:hypothetical protein
VRSLSAVLLLSAGLLAAQNAEAPVDLAESTDPAERALQALRCRLLNSLHPSPPLVIGGATNDPPSAKRSGIDPRPSGPPASIFVDRAPFRPDARTGDLQPRVAESDTILLGSVTKVQPYLSEDKTSLFTEYTLTVEEAIKDTRGLSLKKSSVGTLYRIGGSLRLPSGAVVRTEVHGLGDPPAANHRYICFLRYDARGYWFQISRLWELRNGSAVPMDPLDLALAQAGSSDLTGQDESSFLSAVRAAVEREGARR